MLSELPKKKFIPSFNEICFEMYPYLFIYLFSNSRSNQCSTIGVTKAVVCAILSIGTLSLI